MKYQKADEEDGADEKQRKSFYNSVLLDRYPYFFIYRYSDCRNEYKKYTERNEITCCQRWCMSVAELQALDIKDKEQTEFLCNYDRYMPVIISRSPMNLLCRRIEQLSEETRKRVKLDEFDYSIMKYADADYTKKDYKKVTDEIKNLLRARQYAAAEEQEAADTAQSCEALNAEAERRFLEVLPDIRITVNAAVDFFYRDNPSKSRDILWSVLGEYIIENIAGEEFEIPVPCTDGEIEYLGERYSAEKIKWRNE